MQHPNSRGVLLFFGGSGNEIEAPLKVLGKRTAALGLDLVVFSYYQQGEERPSVTAVRSEAKAVYAAVQALPTPASRSVYLLGYSLGGWFALDVAASENVRGLVLVGAETTPAEVIHRTDAPWANVVAIRPDADARQLDASLYAMQVRTQTMVVTSHQDEAVPAAVGQELFGMLPAATPKHLVILEGVTHGRYFLSDEFWKQFADYFRLPARAKNAHLGFIAWIRDVSTNGFTRGAAATIASPKRNTRACPLRATPGTTGRATGSKAWLPASRPGSWQVLPASSPSVGSTQGQRRQEDAGHPDGVRPNDPTSHPPSAGTNLRGRFSGSSYGFRLGRNAHVAVRAAREYVGYDRQLRCLSEDPGYS